MNQKHREASLFVSHFSVFTTLQVRVCVCVCVLFFQTISIFSHSMIDQIGVSFTLECSASREWNRKPGSGVGVE